MKAKRGVAQKKMLTVVSPSGDGTVYTIPNPHYHERLGDASGPPSHDSDDALHTVTSYSDRVESLRHGDGASECEAGAAEVPSPTGMKDRFDKVAEMAKAAMDSSYAISKDDSHDYKLQNQMHRQQRMKETCSRDVHGSKHHVLEGLRSGSAQGGSGGSSGQRRHSDAMYPSVDDIDTSIGAGLTHEIYKGSKTSSQHEASERKSRTTALRRIVARKREESAAQARAREAADRERAAKREADCVRVQQLRERTNERVRLMQEAKQV
jgi:hypothetical protein